MAKRKYVAAPGHRVRSPGSSALPGPARYLSETEPVEVETKSPKGRRFLRWEAQGSVIDVTDAVPRTPRTATPAAAKEDS